MYHLLSNKLASSLGAATTLWAWRSIYPVTTTVAAFYHPPSHNHNHNHPSNWHPHHRIFGNSNHRVTNTNTRLFHDNNNDSNDTNNDTGLTLERLAQQLASSAQTIENETNDSTSPSDNSNSSSSSNNKPFRNIVVVLGAGISVAAGIPDFRTPGTGLYSQLEDYQLPYPEAIFELDYFRQNPRPFVTLARAIWPGQSGGPRPTLAHSLLALLQDRNLLRRVYTQNIDGLERLAGVDDDRLVECHGHFATASCVNPNCRRTRETKLAEECRAAYQQQDDVFHCPDCAWLVKPDIVFFGEELPPVFMERIHEDMEECDLLLVMGTSLLVAPVATIPHWVDPQVPRVLINRELVGAFAEDASMPGRKSRGEVHSTGRDVFIQGDCDDGVRKLCELAGDDWLAQLQELHENTQ